MLESLLQWDERCFVWVNKITSNVVFDAVLPILRNAKTWIPLYVFLIVFFIYRYQKNAIYYIGGILLSFALADTVSAHIIKPLVGRLRPCRTPEIVQDLILRVNCGSGYSFPSSHASNHFAIAFFLIILLGNQRPWLWFLGIFWAFSISYAQVYVGVHFPIDVTVGAILGMLIGIFVARLTHFLLNKNHTKK